MRKIHFSVTVTTDAEYGARNIEDALKRLIDVGQSDAQETVESGEGDLDSALVVSSLTIDAPVVVPEPVITMLQNVERWMSGYGTKPQSEMRQEVRAVLESVGASRA